MRMNGLMLLVLALGIVMVVFMTMVHERRYTINKDYPNTHEEQLRNPVGQRHAFVHLWDEIGHRNIQKTAGSNHQDIGHDLLGLL